MGAFQGHGALSKEDLPTCVSTSLGLRDKSNPTLPNPIFYADFGFSPLSILYSHKSLQYTLVAGHSPVYVWHGSIEVKIAKPLMLTGHVDVVPR